MQLWTTVQGFGNSVFLQTAKSVKKSLSKVFYNKSLTSCSPGLGPLVVCETLNPKALGKAAFIRSIRVDLPTPEGPQMTRGRAAWAMADSKSLSDDDNLTKVAEREKGAH